MSEASNLFVVTGGPGSGKSSLVVALAAQGIATKPETGRAIIREQVASGGRALPWADRQAFAALMLERDCRAYDDARKLSGPVVFDRGVADVVGYLRLCGLPVPPDTGAAAERRRYNMRVLVAPPWPEIFAQDDERKQSAAEAEATYRMMLEVYRELGYELVSLPLAPIADRVAFVRAIIGGS